MVTVLLDGLFLDFVLVLLFFLRLSHTRSFLGPEWSCFLVRPSVGTLGFPSFWVDGRPRFRQFLAGRPSLGGVGGPLTIYLFP